MEILSIIHKYYQKGSPLYNILLEHDTLVADKALSIARMHPEMKLDGDFIYEAAMLHDIGIFKTEAPEIYCMGHKPYICHGIIGSDILNSEGYPRHALVCERHTGTGISLAEILEKNYPIPPRNMIPETLEEKLICFADKFYSKTKGNKEKSIEKIRKSISKHGEKSLARFDEWTKLFLG